MLVSTVIDDLLESRRHSKDQALAYFYCDGKLPGYQEPASILSSFVEQLSGEIDKIPGLIGRVYDRDQQTGSGKLKLEECRTILAELFQNHAQIFLVVDALDGCNNTETRSEFMVILDTLIKESSKPVKILISSRGEGEIVDHFRNGPKIKIRAIDNRDDMIMFMEDRLTTHGRLQMSSKLRQKICTELADESKGS